MTDTNNSAPPLLEPPVPDHCMNLISSSGGPLASLLAFTDGDIPEDISPVAGGCDIHGDVPYEAQMPVIAAIPTATSPTASMQYSTESDDMDLDALSNVSFIPGGDMMGSDLIGSFQVAVCWHAARVSVLLNPCQLADNVCARHALDTGSIHTTVLGMF